MKLLLLSALGLLICVPFSATASHEGLCHDDSWFNISQRVYSNWSLNHPEQNDEEPGLWYETNGLAGLQRAPCMDRWGAERVPDLRLV